MIGRPESHSPPAIWSREASAWLVMGAAFALVSCSAVLTQCAQGDVPVRTHEGSRSTERENGPISIGSKPQPVSDELLIVFRPDIPEARRQAIHTAAGTQLLRRLQNGRITHVKIPQGQALAKVQAAYEKFAEVEAVEPNHSMEAFEHEGPAQ